LGGRCRYCHRKISRLYPTVELLFGLLSVLIFQNFGIDLPSCIFWLAVTSLLLSLFFFDLKYLILPDLILLAGLILFVAYRIMYGLLGRHWFSVSLQSSFAGAAALVVLLGAIWYFSGGRWLGFGDVKLVLVLGLIFGLWGGGAILYLAVILGGITAIILLISGRAGLKTKLPFGSFISAAAIIYIFYQTPINTFIN